MMTLGISMRRQRELAEQIKYHKTMGKTDEEIRVILEMSAVTYAFIVSKFKLDSYKYD